jgi:flagellar biosynthesis protein
MSRIPRNRKQAVALRYQPGEDRAPKVTAKGTGQLAERILRLARENGIPIREDRNLVRLLAALELNQEVPPAVYMAVAEILAWVYRLTQRR